jgi:hypothetical protein
VAFAEMSNFEIGAGPGAGDSVLGATLGAGSTGSRGTNGLGAHWVTGLGTGLEAGPGA